MIYFDNGATTFPKPKRVEEAVLGAMRRYGANPGRSGHTLSLNTAVKVYECREAAASLFGAESPEQVVFTCNCTHALNIAIKGALRTGDHVVISDLEHNSVLRPLHTLANRGLITYSIAAAGETEEETVQSFAQELRPNTRLICCTHGSNVWGIRMPVEAIGKLARSRDVLFLVDAAQTAGVVDIDMNAACIDFLCTAGHKSLYGPSGTGLLITPHGSSLYTLTEGGTGSMSADFGQPEEMPDRLESGTVNTMGIIGLGAGISYVREKTTATIYGHEMKLAKLLYRSLSETKGVSLYTASFEMGRHLPVVSFNIEGLPSEEVAARLSDKGFALRGGLHCAPLAHNKMGTISVGAVRASIGAFNTTEQVNKLCGAVRGIARG